MNNTVTKWFQYGFIFAIRSSHDLSGLMDDRRFF